MRRLDRWYHTQMWPEDMPQRALVVICGKDLLLPVPQILEHLRQSGHPAQASARGWMGSDWHSMCVGALQGDGWGRRERALQAAAWQHCWSSSTLKFGTRKSLPVHAWVARLQPKPVAAPLCAVHCGSCSTCQ